MSLCEIILPQLILPQAACKSKNDLIHTLVEKIYEAGIELPINQHSLIKTIHIREDIGGTLLPSGLSIPHARLKDYEGFVIAFGIPTKAIPQNGMQLRMMTLMISSSTGGPHYLKSLAALTKISRDKVYFEKLCSVKSTEEFLEVLKESELKSLSSEL